MGHNEVVSVVEQGGESVRAGLQRLEELPDLVCKPLAGLRLGNVQRVLLHGP
jgi:hypothetical protein